MPFVHANGLRLFYQDTGSGPPLLLLMGHGLDHGFWAKQIPVYGEHFRCLALDNRGKLHAFSCSSSWTRFPSGSFKVAIRTLP